MITLRCRIQILNMDGAHVRSIGCKGKGKVQFFRPRGVAIDRHRNLWIADFGNHRIQVVTMDGAYVRTIGGAKRDRILLDSKMS